MRIFLILCFFTTNLAFAQCGEVVSVKDGDTFELLFSDNTKQKVRVAYVDAPEHQQEFGGQSKSFAVKMLLYKEVCIDVKYRDPYKRVVAIVKLKNGKIFNEELVKNGMAWHFVKYSDNKQLAALELQARKSKIGLWKAKEPEAPWIWRREHHIGFKSRSKKF